MLYTDRKGNKYSLLPMEDIDRSMLRSIPGLDDDMIAIKDFMDETVPAERTPVCVLRSSSYSGKAVPGEEKTARLICAIPGMKHIFFIYGKSRGEYITVETVEDMSDAGLRERSNEGAGGLMSLPMLKKLKEGIASI